METDVAVAEREPVLPAQPLGQLERVRRLVAHAPAALLVEQAGERVEDGVEVGRDVQAEDLDVVADVDDRRHLLGPGGAGERVHEARAAEPAAENGVGTFARLYAHRRARDRAGQGSRRREDDGSRRALLGRARGARPGDARPCAGCVRGGNPSRERYSSRQIRASRATASTCCVDAGAGMRRRSRSPSPTRARGRRARRHGRLPARHRRDRSTRSRPPPARSRSPRRATAA